MNGNNTALSKAVSTSLITALVSAWDQYRVTPGSTHYLGVTITNRGGQDAVVKVRLESPSPLLPQWCSQLEQWLALTSDKTGELTFCIRVPADVMPQWLDYEVVVRPQGAYEDEYLPATPCRLQILAPDATETSQDPTFSISPLTTPSNPITVQPGVPVPIELLVENRSERVDRFRLNCTGLPADWIVKITYPSNFSGLGLVKIGDSLGINPGDRGTIQVFIQSPPLPLAGNYLPTLRLSSENDPNLGLLALVYLRVEPTYQVQVQIQVVQDQVRRQPAQFNLLFANLGNTPRRVTPNLIPLSPPEDCRYTLPEETLTIAPQTTTQLLLEGQPQRWWTRPWLGGGKVYPFRLRFTDADRHPIVPETLQGQLTWMPRPWWQLLLVILLTLGLVGALAFLLWWYWLRPPKPPNLLEFAAEDSRYAEVNEDMARVRWQIEHPQQIKTLKLTGYSPEGEILSGPLIYQFQNGKMPASLQPFCNQEKTLLVCSQVRSDAFQPGKYLFELTIVPKRRRNKPIVAKSSVVEILAKPMPTVITLLPQSLVYREDAPGKPTPAEANIPVADVEGILLNWEVTMPQDIVALHLIGRDKDGKMIGDLWYNFPAIGKLPKELKPFCAIEATLVCEGVPTGLATIGEYRFELQPLVAGQAEPADAKPKSTEVIKIQPQLPQILSFQINGKDAPAKLLVPFQPGEPIPTIQISWEVQGGRNTQVELNPSPGSVPLVGAMTFPLSPQGGTTLVLQVKTPTGEPLTRSVTLEVYNPNPNESPQDADQGTDTANGDGSSDQPATSDAPSSSSPPPLDTPTPAVNDQLSPAEQPPRFNRR